MKKREVKKTMQELEKKIKENTTWNNIDVDQFTGQFRGVETEETGICLNCGASVGEGDNICPSCYFNEGYDE